MSYISSGKYKAFPVGAQLGKSENTGTDYVEVLFRIADNPEHGYGGYEIRWRGWLTEKARQRTFESLWNMGWEDDLEDFSTLKAPVQIDVGDEEGQDGRTYSRVNWVNRLGGQGLTAPTERPDLATIKQLSAAAKAARAAAAAAGQAPRPAARPAPHAGPRTAAPAARRPPPAGQPPAYQRAAGHDTGASDGADFGGAPLADDDIPFLGLWHACGSGRFERVNGALPGPPPRRRVLGGLDLRQQAQGPPYHAAHRVAMTLREAARDVVLVVGELHIKPARGPGAAALWRGA